MEWQRYKDNGKYLICINTIYSEEADMTFIMEDTYINDDTLENPLLSTEVKGFYYGKEDREDTERFYGGLKAEFNS